MPQQPMPNTACAPKNTPAAMAMVSRRAIPLKRNSTPMPSCRKRIGVPVPQQPVLIRSSARVRTLVHGPPLCASKPRCAAAKRPIRLRMPLAQHAYHWAVLAELVRFLGHLVERDVDDPFTWPPAYSPGAYVHDGGALRDERTEVHFGSHAEEFAKRYRRPLVGLLLFVR